MYEAPHRLVKTLKLLSERLGNRKAAVCRELTKKYETALRAGLQDAAAYYETHEPKGECVIVIEGRSREDLEREKRAEWENMSIEDHVQYYLSQGYDRKEALKRTGRDRGVSKRDIYNYLEQQKK